MNVGELSINCINELNEDVEKCSLCNEVKPLLHIGVSLEEMRRHFRICMDCLIRNSELEK
jgi:hypothetical protein